jgi:hypothetical protein
MKTKFEVWKEYWDDLSDGQKISIRNEYCREVANNEDEVYDFDEMFFETFFSESSAIEVARAVYFGNIQNWSDDYIKFNGYGNLESMSTYDVIEDTEKYYLNEIFEHEEVWRNDIDEDEVDDDYRAPHCEYIKGEVISKLPDIDPEYIDDWLGDNWDEDESDDDLIKQCIEYLSDPENL